MEKTVPKKRIMGNNDRTIVSAGVGR